MLEKAIALVRNFFEKWCRKKIVGQEKIYYFAHLKVWSKSLFADAYRDCKDLVKNANVLYLLDSNIGEAYLFLKYFLPVLEKKNRNNGLKTFVLTSRKIHITIARSLSVANIGYTSKLKVGQCESRFVYRGVQCIVVFNWKYYDELNARIQKEGDHYFRSMVNFFSIKPAKFDLRKVKVSNEVSKLSLHKALQLGLDTSNFALLIPEANSCRGLGEDVARKVINRLLNKGYNILVNSESNDCLSLNCVFSSAGFDIDELFELAKLAKIIISVRCGLIEFLAEAGRPAIVVYTDFKFGGEGRLLENDVLKGYSISDLFPKCCSITEVAYSKFVQMICDD